MSYWVTVPIQQESWPASLPVLHPSGKHSGNGHRRGRSVPSLSLSLALSLSLTLSLSLVDECRTNVRRLSGARKELEKEIEITREIEKGRSARAYGRYQNVFLTDEELADLQASFPTVWGQYIEKLSE